MARETRRRTPEEFLRAVQAEEAAAKRGHLKIFLGYLPVLGRRSVCWMKRGGAASAVRT